MLLVVCVAAEELNPNALPVEAVEFGSLSFVGATEAGVVEVTADPKPNMGAG